MAVAVYNSAMTTIRQGTIETEGRPLVILSRDANEALARAKALELYPGSDPLVVFDDAVPALFARLLDDSPGT